MVELAELQALSYVAQIVGVVGTLTAAFIAVRSYLNANKRAQETRDRELETRQAQLYAQIYEGFKSKEMQDADFELMHLELKTAADWHRLLEDKAKYSAWCMWSCYYEGIGVMVRQNLIDIKWVADLFSGPLIWFWERYKPMVVSMRNEMNYARANSELEYLYDRVLEYAKEHPDFKVSSPVLGAESRKVASQ